MAFRQLRSPQGGGQYVKWDVPKTVKGVFVGLQHGTYKGKPTVTIILKDEQGVQFKVNGTTTIEQAGLYNEQPGVLVELVFKGMGTSKGGNKFADIDVFVDSPEPDPSQARPTTGAASSAAPSGGEESYETLVARLQLTNPNGAKAVLDALAGMNLSVEQKAAKLREFLKAQG